MTSIGGLISPILNVTVALMAISSSIE